jgi:hypothetical protein
MITIGMSGPIRDPSLDTLLELDGQILFVDAEGHYWVKFEVKRCEVSAERPHGLRYSLTLHDRSGERIVGFDNAHPVSSTKGPAKRSKRRHDHKHRLRTIQSYDYQDAAKLLGDFWTEVDAVLKELGALK